MIRYLTYENLLNLNKKLNEMSGKLQTNFNKQRIRDIIRAANNEPDINKAAAIYFYGITKHPFRGANRRTAFYATDIFLKWNGKKLSDEFHGEKTRNLFYKIRDKNISLKETTAELNKVIVSL